MIDIALSMFEGPLDLLLQLVLKDEIELEDVMVYQILLHFAAVESDNSLDEGPDFIGLTTTLLLWKSRHLLPKHERTDILTEDNDPRFEIIHQLIEYCQFKETAKKLIELEGKQSLHHERCYPEQITIKSRLGVEHLSLEDLAKIFQNALSKSTPEVNLIKSEQWSVAEKIGTLRKLYQQAIPISLKTILLPDMAREELIVIFLAILELMKLEEIVILTDGMIYGRENKNH